MKKSELQTLKSADSKAYVDVGLKKPHTVYFNDRVFETDDLRKLETPTLYLDALFPSTYQQVWELLEKGVRVYYLRNTQLLWTLRQQNDAEKNDENDAKILAIVPTTSWKRLVKDDLTLRNLLHQYYAVADNVRRDKLWHLVIIDEHSRTLVKERINFLRRQRYAIERRVLDIAKETLPYAYVSDRLGVRGVSLVTVLTYVDFSKTFRQLAMFAGFCDRGLRNGRFSRKVRRALRALAATAIKHKHQRYQEVYSHYLEELRSRKRAILRVQKRLFKDIWQILRQLELAKVARGREGS